MTSFIAAGGSGRSASVIPAVPAASSVTTIAFIRNLPTTAASQPSGTASRRASGLEDRAGTARRRRPPGARSTRRNLTLARDLAPLLRGGPRAGGLADQVVALG